MIAFLHTSSIHVKRFEELTKRVDPKMVTRHFVHEDLLATALLTGKTDSRGFIEEVRKIKNESPDLIICTCSTYGNECESIAAVERIDKPIAEYLVSNYTKIGLAYTAISTKVISENLILDVAKSIGKVVEVIDCDCTGSWKYFEKGDIDNYEKEIAKTIKFNTSNADVIFLAQASMENAKRYLQPFEKEVVSSAEFGVKAILQQINKSCT